MSQDIGRTINEAGQALGRAWRRRDYDEEAFPDLAERALAASGLHEVLDMPALARWSILTRPHPMPGPTMGSSFGEPPVTLYSEADAGFALEALVWLDGTTAIHDHGFSGAFMVAQGSSLHSQFDFDLEERASEKLRFGDVRWRASELLSRGDVRRIEPGAQFIHSLFHLDRPSVTIVARTGRSAGVQQYSYDPPSVAYDAFYKPEPLETQIRMLASMMTVDKHMLQEAAKLRLDGADLWATRLVLGLLYRHRARIDDWEKLVKSSTERHGGYRVQALLSSFAEAERMLDIIAMRRRVRQHSHRFFLALLLNVPDRTAIFRLIQDRYPEVDPAEQALQWLQELSDAQQIRLELTTEKRDVLRQALAGSPAGPATLPRACGQGEVSGAPRSPLREIWAELQASPLLCPLLGTPGPGVQEP